MKKVSKTVASSLAMATAAFLSLPVTAQAQKSSPCAQLRSGRISKRVRVDSAGPWPLRTDSDGVPRVGHITTNFWNQRIKDKRIKDERIKDVRMGVRVGAEVVDVRMGVRVGCVEARLAPGEGAALRMDFDSEDWSYTKGNPLLGVRIIVVPDPSDKRKNKKSTPRVIGTTQSNILTTNENIADWK